MRSVITIGALHKLAGATVSNLSGQYIILWCGFISHGDLSRGQCGPSRNDGANSRRGLLSGLRKFRKMQRYDATSNMGAAAQS